MRWDHFRKGPRPRAGGAPLEWLVAGLGNPGPKYAGTRHNAGFEVVEELASRTDADLRAKYQGRFATTRLGDEPVGLLMPLTYMNLSGQSVKGALKDIGLAPDRLVVVHDEVDLPFGRLQVKVGGGLAGHNGLKSIAAVLGTRDFVRVRVGVGRPPETDRRPMSAWVLTRFDTVDDTESLYSAAADAVQRIVVDGAEQAMNVVNSRP